MKFLQLIDQFNLYSFPNYLALVLTVLDCFLNMKMLPENARNWKTTKYSDPKSEGTWY